MERPNTNTETEDGWENLLLFILVVGITLFVAWVNRQ